MISSPIYVLPKSISYNYRGPRYFGNPEIDNTETKFFSKSMDTPKLHSDETEAQAIIVPVN